MRQKTWIAGALSLLALACTDKESAPKTSVWKVGAVYPSAAGPDARGFLDRRGLIHAHSVYSHDACDNQPVKDGVRDGSCLTDFRRDLCAVQHDFVFLTDHGDGFADTPFPDTLLHRVDQGDRLVERGGLPVASWMTCPGDRRALVMAGTETKTMPVGLESHVGNTPDERNALYGSLDPQVLERFRAQGAVNLVAHTEEWTVDQLSDLPLDGFEMYNLHANTKLSAADALLILGRVLSNDPTLPSPDLIFLSLFKEDPIYLERWGTVLSRGRRRVTTMGTDCHRNSFPPRMSDGERIDSYRRMMGWFSNHLRVRPEADGSWDDRHLKAALREGRLYGVFEVLGTPDGFDFFASQFGGSVSEMGQSVALSSQPVLTVRRPRVRALDPQRQPPAVQIRLLRAREGGWDVVADSASDITFSPTTAGAYRTEVRMVPHHLREDLGDDADALLSHDYVWIYSNPIYVE